MGWPRKNECMRLYQDKVDKSYLVVEMDLESLRYMGGYGAIANVLRGATPSLGSTMVTSLYLLNRCKRVEWQELPKEWKVAIRRWMTPKFRPTQVRGFWRVR